MPSTPPQQDEDPGILHFCSVCRKRTTKEFCSEHEAKINSDKSLLFPDSPSEHSSSDSLANTSQDIPTKDKDEKLKGGNERQDEHEQKRE